MSIYRVLGEVEDRSGHSYEWNDGGEKGKGIFELLTIILGLKAYLASLVTT